MYTIYLTPNGIYTDISIWGLLSFRIPLQLKRAKNIEKESHFPSLANKCALKSQLLLSKVKIYIFALDREQACSSRSGSPSQHPWEPPRLLFHPQLHPQDLSWLSSSSSSHCLVSPLRDPSSSAESCLL